MTVSSTQVRVAYTTDGVSNTYTIPWLFYANTDLLVLLDNAQITTGFSVTGAGTGSGTLTASPTLAAGHALQIILNPPLTQQVNLVDGTAFPSATINQENDRSIQVSLRLNDQITRSIRAPDGDVLPSMMLPAAANRSGLVLAFDANGNISLIPQTGAVAPYYLTTVVDARSFGVVGNGTTDDTAALQSACNSLTLGGTVVVPAGLKLKINGNVTVPANVTVQGPFAFPGSNATNTGYDYSKVSAIRLSSSATITLKSGAGLTGLLIYQQALSFPQANPSNFAGTAVTIAGDDTFVVRCMLLGFSQCILCVGYQRPRFDYVQFDGVNGIKIAQCFDVARLNHCHGWPFVTVGWGPSGTATRTGTAYQIGDGTSDSCDFIKVNDCFEYGYQNGFYVQNSSNVTLLNCAVDMVNSIATTSVGFTFTGTGNDCQMLGGTVSWQGTGVLVNTSAPAENTVKLIGVSVFNPQDTVAGKICVSVTAGQCTAESCNFAIATIGIDAHLSNGGVTVNDCYFDTVTTPINVAGGGKQLSNIFDNYYFNCTATISELALYQNEPALEQKNVFGTTGFADQILFSRGTVASPATAQTGDMLCQLQASAYNGSAFVSTVAFRATLVGTVSGSAMPSQWVMSVTPSGSNVIGDVFSWTAAAYFPVTDNAVTLGSVSNRWSITYSGQLVTSVAASSVAAGSVAIGGTTATTVGAAGAATALPANPLGYLIINVGGTQAKIPYYNT